MNLDGEPEGGPGSYAHNHKTREPQRIRISQPGTEMQNLTNRSCSISAQAECSSYDRKKETYTQACTASEDAVVPSVSQKSVSMRF